MTSRQNGPRALRELVDLVAQPGAGSRVFDIDVARAFEAGLITTVEARVLTSHAKRSPISQKRALRELAPTQDAEVAAMRAKLHAASARLNAMYPHPHRGESKNTSPVAGPATSPGDDD